MDESKIRVAGNTHYPCLIALVQKGYDVVICSTVNSSHEEFEAEKDGNTFSATNPQELLGLVAMWEVRGQRWREFSDDDRRIQQEIEDGARIYDDDGNDISSTD